MKELQEEISIADATQQINSFIETMSTEQFVGLLADIDEDISFEHETDTVIYNGEPISDAAFEDLMTTYVDNVTSEQLVSIYNIIFNEGCILSNDEKYLIKIKNWDKISY